MGDTSETNTKVLSRELFLGVVALKRLYRKIIICATRTLFSGTVTYIYVTVPGKRVLVAQIMIFLYRRFSATTPKINSRDKTFVFVSEVSPTLCLHSR